MKTSNLLFTALTALALSVLAGCSSETEFPQETPDIIPPGVTRIEFAIKGVKTGTSYAAAPSVALEENERTINDVTAYLFKLDGTDVLNDNSVVTDVLPATLGANTGKGSFDLGKSTTETRYAVVFVANKACFNPALAAVSKTSNTTYAALNAIETLENTILMEGLKTLKGLPMRALTTIIVPAGGGKVAMEAKFARPLSRFDIDNRAVHSFTVESVTLKNGRKTSPLNVPGTPYTVAGGGLSNIDYTSFLSDVNKRLDAPNADGSVTQLRPAFYLSPALDADGVRLEVTGQMRVGLDYYTRTYNVPLVNKDTQSPITLGINKRYRLTLLMDKDENIIGEIALDLGTWGDDGTDTPDVLPDLDLQVNVPSITAGATYTAATRTFNVPGGVGSFQFEMLNDAGLNVTTDGTVVAAVAAVTAPISRGVNATIYQVTLGAAGTGHFTFATDGGTQYRFNVELVAFDPSKYPGTNLDPIEFGNVLWAPVNVGATKIGEPGWLFQYGRMSHWNSTADIASNSVTIESLLPSKAATDHLGKFLVPTNSDYGRNWWGPMITEGDEKTALGALIAYWNGVSDDATTTTHPCPTGWRLPINSEVEALLQDASQTTGTVNGVSTVAVNGVTFVANEHYLAGTGAVAKVSGYWLEESEGDMNSISNPMRILQCTTTVASIEIIMHSSSAGYSIRCVKTKPVAP